ncbi:MAG: hypothetical protein Q8L34_07015 [Candidatus Woesearchaeota archaeon]|nr:hypothetical protein [Candidatus Woesearchaeota archaeon]
MNDHYQSIRKKFRVLPPVTKKIPLSSWYSGNAIPIVPNFDGEFILSNEHPLYQHSTDDEERCQDRKPLTELE